MNKGDLRVIGPGMMPIRRPDAFLYRDALLRLLEQNDGFERFDTMMDWYGDQSGVFKKFLFLVVRFIRHGGKVLREGAGTREAAQQQMNLMFSIMDMFSMLTPRELMQMFPVDKRYDGKRWEEKDYFFTMEKLRVLDWDKPVGEQADAFELLIDYQNMDIDLLVVEVMMSMSLLRQFQGQPGIMEEFMQENGVTPLILHEKEGYLYDPATGKSHALRKPRKRIPKWLKVISCTGATGAEGPPGSNPSVE